MVVRVLMVEASPSVRNLLRRILGENKGLDLVAETGAPQEVEALIRSSKPDLAMIDVESVSGEAALKSMLALVRTVELPVVVLSNPKLPDRFDLAHRSEVERPVVLLPRPVVTREWEQLREDLPELLRSVGTRKKRPPEAPVEIAPPPEARLEVVGIGASAGGPGALRDLLSALAPALTRLKVLVIQHIGAEFEHSLVDWLAQGIPGVGVGLARDGEVLQPGMVRIAPQGRHLRVQNDDALRLTLEESPDTGRHRPSVDILFESLRILEPTRVGAVILSGMGRDGAKGLLELKNQGCLTVVQDEASCAVFGMPRAALDIGAAHACLSPQEIGRLFAAMCGDDPG